MKRVLALACLAALVGCDDDDNFKKVQDLNLSKPLNPTVMTFASGQTGPQLGPPALNNFCFLTRVSGDFQGGGERVRLRIDEQAQGGPRWVLSGTAGSAGGVSAQAICVSKGKFATKLDNANAMSVTNPTGEAGMQVAMQCGEKYADSGVTKLITTTRAMYFTGMSGRWSGAGETFGLTALKNGPGQNLSGASCQGSGAWVSAYNLRPDGTPIKYHSPKGVTTDLTAATYTTFSVNAPDPGLWDYIKNFGFLPTGEVTTGGPVTMAPVDKAVCGLTGISGKFRGGAEFIQIAAENGNWVLRTGNAQETGWVAATARCAMREQRN